MTQTQHVQDLARPISMPAGGQHTAQQRNARASTHDCRIRYHTFWWHQVRTAGVAHYGSGHKPSRVVNLQGYNCSWQRDAVLQLVSEILCTS
jgi:hypothetical protein